MRPKSRYAILKILFVILCSVVLKSRVLAQEVESTARIEIQEFAKFPGGADKFYEYIKKNLKYPSDAQRDSLSGVVYVEFSLSKDGTIERSSVKVVKSLSPSCDDEALRLIKGAPAWSPARANDQDVGQMIIFPVSFVWNEK